MTDKYISTWLRQQKRDGIILATKVAGYGNKYLRTNGEETRITAEQVEESVNGSLQRLGTDYIDLLQVFLGHCSDTVPIASSRRTLLYCCMSWSRSS